MLFHIPNSFGNRICFATGGSVQNHEPVFLFVIANEEVDQLFHLLNPGKKVRIIVSQNHSHVFKVRLLHNHFS